MTLRDKETKTQARGVPDPFSNPGCPSDVVVYLHVATLRCGRPPRSDQSNCTYAICVHVPAVIFCPSTYTGFPHLVAEDEGLKCCTGWAVLGGHRRRLLLEWRERTCQLWWRLQSAYRPGYPVDTEVPNPTVYVYFQKTRGSRLQSLCCTISSAILVSLA